MRLRAEYLLFADVPLVSQCGASGRQGAVCGNHGAGHEAVRHMRGGVCSPFQPCEILRSLRPAGTQAAEERKRPQEALPFGRLEAEKARFYGLCGQYSSEGGMILRLPPQTGF